MIRCDQKIITLITKRTLRMPEINRSDVTNVVECKDDAVVHFVYQDVEYSYFCWMNEVFESHDGDVLADVYDFEDFDIILNHGDTMILTR